MNHPHEPRHGAEGPYASTSVLNTRNGRYSAASNDVGAQRPHSALDRRRSGSRNETASQMGAPKRQTPTTISKVTRSRSLSSKPAAATGLAVRSPHSLGGPKSVRSATTGASRSQKNSSTTKAGVVVETMSAPNPFCPNTRGICCLMVLVNLGLILVAIGFIIVLQLPEPAFIWNIGIVILVFGFITMFVALLYCMCICQESQVEQRNRGQPELYWTHHWQKNITIPEIKSKDKSAYWEQDRFPEDDLSDTSSRDYPRLHLDSDYGQRTDRENDVETEQEIMPSSAQDRQRERV